MTDIAISDGCGNLAAHPHERNSINGYNHIAAGNDRFPTAECDHFTPTYATAHTWTTTSPPTAPAQHPSLDAGIYGTGAWSASIIGQMFDAPPDAHIATAPPYLPNGALEISSSFDEYYEQSPPPPNLQSSAPPHQYLSQADFSDLLRLTVTVSSSGHSKRSRAAETPLLCQTTYQQDDVLSENVSSLSVPRTAWVPTYGYRMPPESALYSTRAEQSSVSVHGSDPLCRQETLPLVQSFRAIEMAIATNNKRALKEAVNRLATVMVNKDTSSETSEPISTSSEIGVAWQDSLRLSPAPVQSQDSNLTRLLTLLQQISSDNLNPQSMEQDTSMTSKPSESDVPYGDDLAKLILHANQRHHSFPQDCDVVPSNEPSTVETSFTDRSSPSSQAKEEKARGLQAGDGKQRVTNDLAKMKVQGDEDNDSAPLELCKGNILALSLKDQSTCRSLQKHVKEASPKVRAVILQEALPHFVRLMTDPIGNYFCQTVLQLCSQEDLRRILDRVWKHLPAMSKSLYGTRAVQKLIERCCPTESKKLLKAFAGHFHDLAIDACGSHVIRQILESIPPEQSDLVHAEIRGNVLEIAMTKRGCCAVQKSLDHSTEQQRMLLVEKILEHIPQLIQDPFGNYVIQHVLNMEDASINSRILEYVLIDLWYLSKHKFASNVVERCVRLSNPYQLGSIMGSLVSLGVRKVRELLEDSFGNYVIQSVLETVPHDTYGPLDRVVAFCLPDLDQTAHGRRIAQILLAKFPFLADTPKLYREGKSRLSSDNPTDSSNVPTSDNSLEPRSSTENSRDRSSSSSCSKAHKEKISGVTSSGGDTSTKKPRSDDQLHGSQTDNSALMSVTDGSTPGRRTNGGSTGKENQDAGQSTSGVRPPRPNPHNLSVAINRFRNSRRQQSVVTEGTQKSNDVAGNSASAMSPTNGEVWLSGSRSGARPRAHDPSRGKASASNDKSRNKAPLCAKPGPIPGSIHRLASRDD